MIVASLFLVSDEAENLANRAAIVELAAKGRIPAMYAYSDFVRVGGLMAYSTDLPDTFRRFARMTNWMGTARTARDKMIRTF